MSDIAAHLGETAERILERYCTKDVMEGAEAGPGATAQLWDALTSAGIPYMMCDEKYGGIEADTDDLITVLRIAGFHGAPVPLAETIVAAWVLSKAGLPPRTGRLSHSLEDDCWTISASGELTGRAQDVSWANDASYIVFVGSNESGRPMAGVARSDRINCKSTLSVASEPLCTLIADRLHLDAAAEISEDVRISAFKLAALARAALIDGALQRVLQLSSQYVKDRVQFGKPLAGRQAVQQQLAELMGAVAASSVIVAAAAKAFYTPTGGLVVAAARGRLADAVNVATSVGHQVHGAMGFSREYPLQYATRRLWSWRDADGSAAYWRAHLSRSLDGGDHDGLWPKITSVGTNSGLN
jgi:acyl-CoA dehydrogenase